MSSLAEIRRMALVFSLLFIAAAATQSVAFGQDDDDDTVVRPNFGDDPDGPIDPRFERAQLLHLEGLFDQAYQIYDQILVERPADVPTIVTYGNMKWKEGELAEAELRFKRAIELMPHHIKARQFLGQMYRFMGRRKEAREQLDAMQTLKFIRDDHLHSARLNLGQIEMQESRWRQAREQFTYVRANGHKADRNSGERGLTKVKWMMQLEDWPRLDTNRLYIHFSPAIEKYRDKAAREAYGRDLDIWMDQTIARLGMQAPDPWHLYVFQDDGECSGYTGRKTAHGWDYTWWLSFNAVSSRYSARHTLAVQLASRAIGSRPASRSFVEGFCAYLAGDPADPHATARAMHRSRSLPTIPDLYRDQRSENQYDVGISFVRWLIDTHGLDKFFRVWKRFNIITDAPRFNIGRSRETDWGAAIDELFNEAFGQSLIAAETAWRGFLAAER